MCLSGSLLLGIRSVADLLEIIIASWNINQPLKPIPNFTMVDHVEVANVLQKRLARNQQKPGRIDSINCRSAYPRLRWNGSTNPQLFPFILVAMLAFITLGQDSWSTMARPMLFTTMNPTGLDSLPVGFSTARHEFNDRPAGLGGEKIGERQLAGKGSETVHWWTMIQW